MSCDVRFDGSRQRARCCTSADLCWFSLTCSPVRDDCSWYRVGTSEGRIFASRRTQQALLLPKWLTSYGQRVCIDASREAGHTIFIRTLRFDSNYARDLANNVLIALARSAQWTGFYACHFDALVCIGALTILTGMTAAMQISWYVSLISACHTQILNHV